MFKLIPLFVLCSTIFSYAGEQVSPSTSEMVSCNAVYLKNVMQENIRKQTRKIAKLQERLILLEQNPDELDAEELSYQYEKLQKKIKSEQEALDLMITAYRLAEEKFPN